MEYLFALAGLAWVFCGALVLGLSSSGTHEIIACLVISFGGMFLGLSALLRKLRALNATWKSAHFLSGPPPISKYTISIEEAIADVRAAVRLAERQKWIDAIHHPIAYPSPAQYFAGTLPLSLPASAEYLEGEYYIEQPRTEAQQISN
jgi:hypothetical protein